MPITFEQAIELTHGQILFSNWASNKDGSPKRYKVNGKVKRWKRDKYRLEIPIKHGLYQHGYITNGKVADRIYHNTYSHLFSLNDFELTEEQAIEMKKYKE